MRCYRTFTVAADLDPPRVMWMFDVDGKPASSSSFSSPPLPTDIMSSSSCRMMVTTTDVPLTIRWE